MGRRDAHQRADHDAGRHRAGGARLQSRLADRAARQPRDALDPRHRARQHAAVVSHDDHALEGRAAGDRLPVDRERARARGGRRGAGHADGDRVRRRARRAGRGADPGRVHLPDPRALRFAGHAPPRAAEGTLRARRR